MSFAGAVLACWLAIAAIAFYALSALTRLAARGDVEPELGIVGEAELRVLLGERNEDRLSLETRLAHLGAASAHHAWTGRGIPAPSHHPASYTI
jgi:hypothetical protein